MLRSVVTLMLAAVVASSLACGGGSRQQSPAPSGSEAVVRQFMRAVKDSNLSAMSQVWGSSRGLAADRMSADDVRRRLVVTQLYLQHEQYEILPDSMSSMSSATERQFQVKLTRRGCTPVVPFTVAKRGDGWLVQSVDLAAAGNPAMDCRRQGE